MSTLKDKLARLKVKYEDDRPLPASEILALLEDLRQRVEESFIGQSTLWDAVAKLEHRVSMLEQTAPTYRDPRGS